MFKTFLFSLGITTYHYFSLVFLNADILVPEWLEKVSTIGLLSGAVWYLIKEQEKNKADSKLRQEHYESKFEDIQNKLFDVEKESIRTISQFQSVMVKIADTLETIQQDLKESMKSN
jgi:ABC-type nickel/cobalt efflux system permease component RcnA